MVKPCVIIDGINQTEKGLVGMSITMAYPGLPPGSRLSPAVSGP